MKYMRRMKPGSERESIFDIDIKKTQIHESGIRL
jgi:hypothetical protein